MPSWFGSKKGLERSVGEKRLLVDREHAIPIVRQAELLGLSRASVYATPLPPSPENLKLAEAVDRLYTAHPFYGTRRLAYVLNLEGFDVGRKRIRSIMCLLGLEALYPKRNTSKPDHLHRIYPYLLRRLAIEYPNHVWGTDITYVRLTHGFCYLVAIIDWYSRYVVAWELSPTLEIPFCLENIARALETGTPLIHNSDQGSHFTSPQYTDILSAKGIAISMDGRGRCMDNIFTERLWRTVKYEDIYLKGYATIGEVRAGLTDYFRFYNTERPHQSLNYQTPASLYFATDAITKPKRAATIETLSTITV
jgi:putative transposase